MSLLNDLKNEWMKTGKFLGLKFAEETPVVTDKVYTSDEIKISERVVGGKVELIDSEGGLTPAPDAAYVIEDGFSFIVKDGQISEIEGEDAPVPTEEVKEEMAEEPVPAAPVEDKQEDDKIMQMLHDLVSKVDALAAEVETLKGNKQVDEVREEFSKEVGQVKEAIIKLSKLPAEESKTSKSNPVQIQKEKNKRDAAALAKAFMKK